jgi:glycosyltransferase involved in cell wall biosynthesis
MKIVVAHNFYMQPGGEDQVFRAEIELLREYGHDVVPFEIHNDAVADMSNPALLVATVWNRETAGALREVVRKHQPQIVHFHNTFPLMSPAALYSARAEGAAVVQTLHNFRLLCPGSLLYRDGHACHECLGKKFAMPAIRHGCYRGSRAATAVTAVAITIHRTIGTWDSKVDAYIALTPFAHDKFIEGGIPQEKLHIKPNFLHTDPGARAGGGGYATFVGRLSQEKGLPVLLNAWAKLGRDIRLKIIGDGPMAPQVRAAVADNPAIEWVGHRSMSEIFDIVGGADLHVFPSQCYETFGRVAIEAFAVGTPVVASGHGAMADLVGSDGRLGAIFTPGDPDALATQVRQLLSSPTLRTSMRKTVREEFENHYTGPRNHVRLMQIYNAALGVRHGTTSSAGAASRESAPMAARLLAENPI